MTRFRIAIPRRALGSILAEGFRAHEKADWRGRRGHDYASQNHLL